MEYPLIACNAAQHAKSKMAARGPQNGQRKGVYHYAFGLPGQLSLNKFFDPSTSSMRKGNSGEKQRRKRRKRKD